MWVALAVSALVVPEARATVVLPADLETLVRVSAVIACGRVADVDVRMVDGRRRIERVITIEVEEYYKGGAGRELRVRVPGGRLGHLRTVTVGAPEFTPGEDVVLFVGGDAARGWYPVGLWQGVFRVRAQDGNGGARVVFPTPLLRDAGRPRHVVRGDPARRPMRLDALTGEIRRLGAQPARRRPARER